MKDRHQLPGDVQVVEQRLNTAITNADISRSFEEYFEIFDAFYAEDIELSSHQKDEQIRGKANVRGLLYNFLVPLHDIAEIGGVTVTVRATSSPGDGPNETQSAWTLDLTAPSGAKCTLTWSVMRTWNGSQVLYERHYDHQQTGGPLTFEYLHAGSLEVRA